MQKALSKMVKEALKVRGKDFTRLVEETAQLLAKENGQVGNFNVIGRLVKIKPLGEAVIVSDLHGDMESLIHIIEETNFLQRMSQNKKAVLIFLGDYGDRGINSAEIYYIVLRLKLLFPEQVILMRGNHEGPEDLMASPHDLPMQFRARFGEKWRDVYSETRGLFEYLYNAVFVEERYLMIHGGLPPEAKTLEDLAYAHTKHPKERLLEDMLWSDPTEMIEGVCESPRGAGKLFGQKITNEMLRRFNVKILIRGHEPCRNGFKINHRGKILTLFSRKGPPYLNVQGAYLNVELSKNFKNAEQLIPFIFKF